MFPLNFDRSGAGGVRLSDLLAFFLSQQLKKHPNPKAKLGFRSAIFQKNGYLPTLYHQYGLQVSHRAYPYNY